MPNDDDDDDDDDDVINYHIFIYILWFYSHSEASVPSYEIIKIALFDSFSNLSGHNLTHAPFQIYTQKHHHMLLLI